jgi:hypothetical protein
MGSNIIMQHVFDLKEMIALIHFHEHKGDGVALTCSSCVMEALNRMEQIHNSRVIELQESDKSDV